MKKHTNSDNVECSDRLTVHFAHQLLLCVIEYYNLPNTGCLWLCICYWEIVPAFKNLLQQSVCVLWI